MGAEGGGAEAGHGTERRGGPGTGGVAEPDGEAGPDAGALYDLGYQPYAGERRGRSYVRWTVFTQALRRAFGLERGGRALFAPWALLTLAAVPALVQVGISGMVGEGIELVSYHDYLSPVQMLLALFCAGQAPELVSRDQHHGVLPLYLARGLERSEYALSRLAGMVAAVFLLVMTPMAILFVGHLGTAAEFWSALTAEAQQLPAIVGSALLAAVVLGGLSLAVAAWTHRRGYATAGILGIFLVSAPVSAALLAADPTGPGRYALLASPLQVIDGLMRVFFGREPMGDAPEGTALESAMLEPAHLGLAAFGMVAASTAVLLVRYARIRA